MTESPSTEFGAFLAAGADIDVWLGDAVLLGVGAAVETPLGAEKLQRESIAVGIHLGFAWEPSSGG